MEVTLAVHRAAPAAFPDLGDKHLESRAWPNYEEKESGLCPSFPKFQLLGSLAGKSTRGLFRDIWGGDTEEVPKLEARRECGKCERGMGRGANRNSDKRKLLVQVNAFS